MKDVKDSEIAKKMKISKIIKYQTSDGQIFIGGENREHAFSHERSIQESLSSMKVEEDALDILKIYLKGDLRSLAKGMIREKDHDQHRLLSYIYDEDFRELVDVLFEEAICPGDIDDFDDLVRMIGGTIDQFGGLQCLHKFYDLYKKIK
jgi:hypothetical protein